ncbi:hypothetical protein THF5H11_20701 [Vibrio jasicida]|nr:hypothetical protein THF5H11_20701 [Vibrio jasicida]
MRAVVTRIAPKIGVNAIPVMMAVMRLNVLNSLFMASICQLSSSVKKVIR